MASWNSWNKGNNPHDWMPVLKRAQVELKGQLKQQVLSWSNRHKGNIRGLLGSLQTVLWEGSEWQPVGMSDLLDAGQVGGPWQKHELILW